MKSVYFMCYYIYSLQNNLLRFYYDTHFITRKLKIREAKCTQLMNMQRLAFEPDAKAHDPSVRAHCVIHMCNWFYEMRECPGLPLNGQRVKKNKTKKENNGSVIRSDSNPVRRTGFSHVIFSLGRNCPCSFH